MVKKYIFTSKNTSPRQIIVTSDDPLAIKRKIAQAVNGYVSPRFDPEYFVKNFVGIHYSVRVIDSDGTELLFDCAEGNIW